MATDYLNNVTTWAASLNNGWSAYQVALAEADKDLVAAMGQAAVDVVTASGNAQVAWTSSTTAEMVVYANAEANAHLQRITGLVNPRNAHAAGVAGAQLTYSTDTAQATATHDKNVVAAGLTLAQSQSTALATAAQGGVQVEDAIVFHTTEGPASDGGEEARIPVPTVEQSNIVGPAAQISIQGSEDAAFAGSRFAGTIGSPSSEMFQSGITDVWNGEVFETLDGSEMTRPALNANRLQPGTLGGGVSNENPLVRIHDAAARRSWSGFGQAPAMMVAQVPSEVNDILKALRPKGEKGQTDTELKEKPARTGKRTWTDSTGKHTVEAALLSIDGDTVVLRRAADKKDIRVPIKSLSERDRQFIDFFKTVGGGAELPDTPNA